MTRRGGTLAGRRPRRPSAHSRRARGERREEGHGRTTTILLPLPVSQSKRKTTLRRRCAAIQIDDASSLEETRDFFLSIMSEVVERDTQQHDELYSTSILRRRRLLHQESRFCSTKGLAFLSLSHKGVKMEEEKKREFHSLFSKP